MIAACCNGDSDGDLFVSTNNWAKPIKRVNKTAGALTSSVINYRVALLPTFV